MPPFVLLCRKSHINQLKMVSFKIVQKTTVVCNCDSLFKNILDIFAKKFISSFLKESQHLRLSSIHPIPKTSNINL